MGLPTYGCAPTFPASVPDLMERNGFLVRSEALRVEPTKTDYDLFGQIYNFRVRRRAGTVYLTSFFKQDDGTLRFILTCGNNPLLWPADMRLLREVETVVLLHCASSFP
jgi:hypothetical protein